MLRDDGEVVLPELPVVVERLLVLSLVKLCAILELDRLVEISEELLVDDGEDVLVGFSVDEELDGELGEVETCVEELLSDVVDGLLWLVVELQWAEELDRLVVDWVLEVDRELLVSSTVELELEDSYSGSRGGHSGSSPAPPPAHSLLMLVELSDVWLVVVRLRTVLELCGDELLDVPDWVDVDSSAVTSVFARIRWQKYTVSAESPERGA